MQTIGERLLEARQRRGVSVREAADSTKVRGQYLMDMEANQFDAIPLADVYKRGFLKIYAKHLRLDADRIVGEYNGLLAARAPHGGKHRRITDLNDGAIRPIESREPVSPDEFSSGAIEMAERPDNRNKTILIGGAASLVALVVIALAVRGCEGKGDTPARLESAPASAWEGEIKITSRNDQAMPVRLVRVTDGSVVREVRLNPQESVVVRAAGQFELYASPLDKVVFSVNGGKPMSFPPGFAKGPVEIPAKSK